ncbi:uncharacterized protein [Drosophila kikkawai]|uniref:Uncharacterized protein n=1 Tax=Drosophila kikkawai TaxID=30033 RepID=A0A6P4HZ13_DROKI|nr:uncharacterized protein LOC108074239 isoform X1 [Drosophila kikkawai]
MVGILRFVLRFCKNLLPSARNKTNHRGVSSGRVTSAKSRRRRANATTTTRCRNARNAAILTNMETETQVLDQVTQVTYGEILMEAGQSQDDDVIMEGDQSLPQGVPQSVVMEGDQSLNVENPQEVPRPTRRGSRKVQKKSKKVAQAKPQDISQDLHLDVSQDLHLDVSQDLHLDVPQDLHLDVSQDLPEGVPQGLPQYDSQDESQGVPQVVPPALVEIHSEPQPVEDRDQYRPRIQPRRDAAMENLDEIQLSDDDPPSDENDNAPNEYYEYNTDESDYDPSDDIQMEEPKPILTSILDYVEKFLE